MRTRCCAALTALGLGATLVLALPAQAAPARHFANCTAMHRVYPHGVGMPGAHDHVTSGVPVTNFTRSAKLYSANRGSDRDGDHVACEAR